MILTLDDMEVTGLLKNTEKLEKRPRKNLSIMAIQTYVSWINF